MAGVGGCRERRDEWGDGVSFVIGGNRVKGRVCCRVCGCGCVNRGRFLSVGDGLRVCGWSCVYMGRVISVWAGLSVCGGRCLYMGRVISVWEGLSVWGERSVYLRWVIGMSSGVRGGEEYRVEMGRPVVGEGAVCRVGC